MVDSMDKLAAKGYTLFQASPRLCFAVLEDNVYMLTPVSTFKITKSKRNSRPGHARILENIKNYQYKTPADIITDMNLNVSAGVGYILIDTRSLCD